MEPTARANEFTVLGFDFGSRRIGVAVGNSVVRVAHPLATIATEENAARFAAIAGLIDEWQPGLLVVGRPVHADGTEHRMTVRADRFARQLEGRFGLVVALVDERYTSQVAESALAAAGAGAHARKEARDRVAAQLILQSWFDDDKGSAGRGAA